MQQNFLDPLLPVASRAARQPWHFPVPVVVAKPQRGQIPANPLGHLDVGCQRGMGQLSTSGHLCPPATLHCAHSLATEGSSQLCPLPTAPCLQLSLVGLCTLFLLHTPTGIFPSLVALCKPLCSQPRIPLPHPALWRCFTSPLSVSTSPVPAM